MDTNARVYASTVTEGPFSYHHYQGLTVNRHLREPGDQLYALLTWQDTGPALRKDGKPKVHQPPKHRDPNDAFYHAQCVLYGLKPLKTKAAAKKELLKAWERGGRKFVVPDQILRIEGDLKEAFKVANLVAKEKYEEDEKVRLEAERKQQLKRKREDEKLSTVIAVAREKSKKQKPNKQLPLDLTRIAGCYDVVCSYLRDNYGSSYDDDDSYNLSIGADTSGKQVWGEFDFGAFEGYLCSTSIDKVGRTISFNWRGRETGEGESTFGDVNKLIITFLDEKTFEGRVEGDMFESCEITGELAGPVGSGSVSAWKYQYDILDEDNYEHERIGRWH